MRKVALSLVAAALLLLPASSYAGSGHGWHGGHGFHGHGFHGHGFHGHGFVVVGPGCCWGPWWWWGYPPYYYPPATAYYPPPYYYPPAYYTPPTNYAPPPSYGPPSGYAAPTATVSVAPAQQTPNVVQYATGRYELRGNGVSTPYRWVWIPNPPTAPPQLTPAGSPPLASAR